MEAVHLGPHLNHQQLNAANTQTMEAEMKAMPIVKELEHCRASGGVLPHDKCDVRTRTTAGETGCTSGAGGTT